MASSAQYKVGALSEKTRGSRRRGDGLRRNSSRIIRTARIFNNALEGEFRIGTAYLEGAKQKVLGIKTLASRDRAIAIYKIIVQNAPFSKYAPLAQFNVGQAYQRQNDLKGRHHRLPARRG